MAATVTKANAWTQVKNLPQVNVLEFPNSSTGGIQEAIDSVTGPVAVILPIGSYEIFDTIDVVKDGVRIVGAGPGGNLTQFGDPPGSPIPISSNLVWKGTQYGRVFNISPIGGVMIRDLDFSRFTIDCASAAGAILCGQAMYINKSTGLQMDSINIFGAAPGPSDGAAVVFDNGTTYTKWTNSAVRTYGARLRPDAAATGPAIQFAGTNVHDVNQVDFRGLFLYYVNRGIYAKAYDACLFEHIFGADISGVGPASPLVYVPSDTPIHGGSEFNFITGGYQSDAPGFGGDTVRMVEDDDPDNHISITDGDATLVYGKNGADGVIEKYYRGPNNTTDFVLSGPRLITDNMRFKPGTFSALPAAGATYKGVIRTVTDSSTATWGATITGGGANNVLAFCNGTNWTVMGK